MRVALFAPEFPPKIGGMERYAFELAKSLSKNNKVGVITREDHKNIDYKKLGLASVNVKCLLTLDFDQDLELVLDYLKNNKADILHINNAGFSPAIPKIKSRLDIPVVVTVHGKDFLNSFIYTKQNKNISKDILNADKIIAVSNYVKSRIIRQDFEPDKVAIILHGTDITLFKPEKKDTKLLKKLGISEQDFVLLTVSRITKRKGIIQVIKLLPNLIKETPNLTYLVIGPTRETDYYNTVKLLVKKLGLERNVIFTGYVKNKELPKYYNLCDIFLMPTTEPSEGDIEGFGIVFLEANSCAKPVIGSKNSGAEDAIINGKTGFLVNINNEKEIEKVIIRLLKNKELREKLGKAGRARVIKELNWNNVTKKVLNVYNSVIKPTIYFNNYIIHNEHFIGGANLYYNEVSQILNKQGFNHLNFHDVLNNPDIIKKIKNKDTVITNCGPYAYIYHYLRKKHNLNFRIVRDVQAALWSGYLLQETLCSKMQQDNDIILFPSEYARQLYIKLFPHINKNNSFVCYPCMKFFPKIKRVKKPSDGLTIGYLGRVSYEKNFKQLLEAFVNVSKKINTKLLVAGRVEDTRFMPNNIKKMLNDKGIKPNNYTHINNGGYLSYNKVWELLQKIDLLIFPSTANVETLGRVILEAAHLNIPIIAAEHAASPELSDKKNLLKVNYFKKANSLVGTCALGSIDVDELCNKITNHKKLSKNTNINQYKDHDKKLLKIIDGKQKTEAFKKLDPNIANFITKLNVVGLDASENLIEKTIPIIKNFDYRRLSYARVVCKKINFKPYLY